MTKYVLHGGMTSIPSDSNKEFFAEMIKGLEEPITILCVYFSRKKEEWQQLFEQDKKHFLEWARQKKLLQFILADDNLEKFIQQIKSADTIYMRGGKETHLAEVLGSIKNIRDLFKGKIIGGSSAGANVLAQQYYSDSEDSIIESLGVLPIKVFVHYSDDKIEKLKKLKGYGEDLKVYTIPEQEFSIIQD